MTIIAYKDGVLASDTQTTNGNMTLFGIAKISGSGTHTWGVAGKAHMIPEVNAWLDKCSADNPHADPRLYRELYPVPFDAEDEVEILIVRNDTRCVQVLDALGRAVTIGTNEDFAIGSGEQFAMGAMRAGATAREAVEIACGLDAYSGGYLTWRNF